jgi:CheY-like chemotaxis protein
VEHRAMAGPEQVFRHLCRERAKAMQDQPGCALLGQLLLTSGALSEEKLADALEEQEQSGEPLGKILKRMGIVSEQLLDRALRAQTRLRGKPASEGTFLLVVDDDPEVGAVLAEILEGAGYRVGVAENAWEATAAVMVQAAYRPALVVLDMGLPGRSGVDLLQSMRESPGCRSLPVVVLTGRPDMLAEIEKRGLEISEFLAKPVPARRLLEAVETALLQSQLAAAR